MPIEPRIRISSLILNCPGLHFREIQRRLSIATGALDYHLKVLTNSGAIKSERQGRFLRFYPRDINDYDTRLWSALRQTRKRKILIFLTLNEIAHYRDIVNELHLSPSTVTWHLKELERAGLIVSKRDGKRKSYTIINPDTLGAILSTYKVTFLDEVVNDFVETWETL
jgi:predicted transcriptional regulator